MIALAQPLFDMFALSLPRGLGFGEQTPGEFWLSEDGQAFGAVTRDNMSGRYGAIARRRRVDQVWATVGDEPGIGSIEAARAWLEDMLAADRSPVALPTGTVARPALYDLHYREPSRIFQSLTHPSHHVAAWMLNQLYLSLPAPDRNWAGDCQTANFHTRLWEAHLLASFREQGLLTSQPCPSPDFHIANRRGGEAWIEAVTANPPVPYDHVEGPQSLPPTDREELMIGPETSSTGATISSRM